MDIHLYISNKLIIRHGYRMETSTRKQHLFAVQLKKNVIECRQPLTTLDRESIASQCMAIHRNPRISKWIFIKSWIIEDWYP